MKEGSIVSAWMVRVAVPATAGTQLNDAMNSSDPVQFFPMVDNIKRIFDETFSEVTIGNYKDVFEMCFGIETFLPLNMAHPSQGRVGRAELVTTLYLTIYIPGAINVEMISKFVNRVASAHPWEHPIIEIISSGNFMMWTPR